MKCLLKQYQWFFFFKSSESGSLQSMLVFWLVWGFFLQTELENVLKLLKIAIPLTYSSFPFLLCIWHCTHNLLDVCWVTGGWCEFYLEEAKQALYFKSDGFETWNYRGSAQSTNHARVWWNSCNVLQCSLKAFANSVLLLVPLIQARVPACPGQAWCLDTSCVCWMYC